jgi:protein ImuB
VEPAAGEPGAFWIDAAGLGRLYPSLEHWAGELRAEIEEAGFAARVAVGFTRFGSYAAVKAKGAGLRVLTDPGEERTRARAVPLGRLAIDPGFRDALDKLGISDLGGLVDLPAAGVRERFGDEAYLFHRLASGDLWSPLQPRHVRPPPGRHQLLDEPVHDTTLLLFHLKRLLHPLLEEIGRAGLALERLSLRLGLERGEDHRDEIRPAAPTLHEVELMGLARLRLERVELDAGVLEIHIEARTLPTRTAQQWLFAEGPRRDLEAADRALALLRAELGEDAVVVAHLAEGHLPEARFSWEPLQHVRPAKTAAKTTATTAATPAPTGDGERPLVRRFFARPRTFPLPRARDPQGWFLRGLGLGCVIRRDGPYRVSGGWWARELQRDYHFIGTETGELLWMYQDRRRKRWVLQGVVE